MSRSLKVFSLMSLSADTCEVIQAAADRQRARDHLDRTRNRKTPLSYQQRQQLQKGAMNKQ